MVKTVYALYKCRQHQQMSLLFQYFNGKKCIPLGKNDIYSKVLQKDDEMWSNIHNSTSIISIAIQNFIHQDGKKGDESRWESGELKTEKN